MKFKDIAIKVINNAELKKALMNYIKRGSPNPGHDTALVPYENLIMFQATECIQPIEESGYQVGEPWSGDIENADILFVSKTLAYAPTEICPRYISLPCEEPDNYRIAVTDCIQKLTNCSSQNSDPDDVAHVIEFCNTRFKNAFLNNRKTLHIQITGRIKRVDYWGAMRKNTEALLLPNVKGILKRKYRGKPIEYAQKLMEHVACTCVVPYKVVPHKVVPPKARKYLTAFNKGGTFQYCWDNFAEDLLSLFLSSSSASKIVVLVGDDVLQVFQKSTAFSALQPKLTETSKPNTKGKTSNIYLYEYNGNMIVNVRNNQGSMGSFVNYFPQNSKIFTMLQTQFSAMFNAHLNTSQNAEKKRTNKK